MLTKFDLRDIDSIIFDLGGVILNLDYNLTINAFRELGGAKFEVLYSQVQQDKIFDLYEIDAITSDEFVAYLQRYLPENTTNATVIESWNKMLLDLPSYRIDFIQQLKNSHSLFLFSNTNDLHYTSFKSQLNERYGNAELLEELFEEACFSHLLKKRKPTPESFNYLIERFRLNPQKTLFIDDSIQHIEGAKKCGLQTYHLVNEDIIDIFDTNTF